MRLLRACLAHWVPFGQGARVLVCVQRQSWPGVRWSTSVIVVGGSSGGCGSKKLTSVCVCVCLCMYVCVCASIAVVGHRCCIATWCVSACFCFCMVFLLLLRVSGLFCFRLAFAKFRRRPNRDVHAGFPTKAIVAQPDCSEALIHNYLMWAYKTQKLSLN